MIRFSVVNEGPDKLFFYKNTRHVNAYNAHYHNDLDDDEVKSFFVEPNGGERVVEVPAEHLREWWPRIKWDVLPIPSSDDDDDDDDGPRVVLEGASIGRGSNEQTMTLHRAENGSTRGYYLTRGCPCEDAGLRIGRFSAGRDIKNLTENKMRFSAVEGAGEAAVCPTRAVGGDMCWYPKQRGLVVLPRGLRPLDAFRPTWLYKGAEGRFGVVAWRALSGHRYDTSTDQWRFSSQHDAEDDAPPCDFEAFGTLAGAVLFFNRRKDALLSAETSDVATLAMLDLTAGCDVTTVAQIHLGRRDNRRRSMARAAKKRKTAADLAIKNLNVVQEEEVIVGVLPLILELSVAFCGARACGVLACCSTAGRDLVIAESTNRAKAIDFEAHRGFNWCFPKQQDKRGTRKELHYTASALFVLQPVEKWHAAYLKTRPKPLDSPPREARFGHASWAYEQQQAEDRALKLEFEKQKRLRALSTTSPHWAQRLYAAERPCYARALPASGWDDPTTLRKLAQLLRANPRTGLEEIAQRFLLPDDREHGGATCEASDVAVWSRALKTISQWLAPNWILAEQFNELPHAKNHTIIKRPKDSTEKTNQRTIESFFKPAPKKN